VCWQLRQADIGNATRSAFAPDPVLPKGVFARVTSCDYNDSDFDCGYMCPAKDRSASTPPHATRRTVRTAGRSG
jgi:DNA/RNA endonuclease G (NUC1)